MSKVVIRRVGRVLCGVAVAFGLFAASHGCDPETRFLHACSASSDCGSELACVCGTCTEACAAASTCQGLGNGATCLSVSPETAASCGSSLPSAICSLRCTKDADCGSSGTARCAAGICLAGSSGPGSDAGASSSDAATSDGGANGCALPGSITALVPRFDANAQNVDAEHLALTPQYVYFLHDAVSCGGETCALFAALARVPRCGGAVEELGIRVPAAGARVGVDDELLLAGGNAYVNAIQLTRVRLTDGAQTTLPFGQFCVSDIAADDHYVYVYDDCNHRIVRAAHDSTNFEVFVAQADGLFLSLTTDALYYTGAQSVFRQPLDGSPSTSVYDAGSALAALAADEHAVFVLRKVLNSSGTLTRIPSSGGSSEDVATVRMGDDPFPALFDSVVVQSGNVYFRQLDASNVVQLMRAPTSGGAPQVVLHRPASNFAADGERIYWSELQLPPGQRGGVFTSLPEPKVPAGPQVNTPPNWAHRYGTSSSESFSRVAASPDHTLLITGAANGPTSFGGATLNPVGLQQAFVVKLSEIGSHVWSTLLSGSELGSQPVCIGTDSSATITAVSDDFFDHQLVMHRLSADARELSVTRRAKSGSGVANCAVDASGTLYLALGDSLFEAYGPTGDLVWTMGTTSDAAGFSASDMTAVPGGFAFTGALAGSVEWDGNSFSGHDSSLVGKISSDGTHVWTKQIEGGLASGLDADVAGQLIVVGSIPSDSSFVRVDGVRQDVPRPYESFTFLAWFAADGTLQRLRVLDGSGPVDVALTSDGSLFFAAGDSDRPFYFDPPGALNNYVYGGVFAKLTSTGDLVSSRSLGPTFYPGVPVGYLGLAGVRVVRGGTHGFVTGTVERSRYPDSAYAAPNDVYSLVDGYAAAINQ